jgi:hypothetical protein
MAEIWITKSLKDLYVKQYGAKNYNKIEVERFVGMRIDKFAREHKNGFFLNTPGYYPISYRVPDARGTEVLRRRIYT